MRNHLILAAKHIAPVAASVLITWVLVWQSLIATPISDGCATLKEGGAISDVEYSQVFGISSECSFKLAAQDKKFQCSITRPLEIALPLNSICEEI